MPQHLRNIVVPVDGSAGSERATALAAQIAKGTGAKLTLLHVLDTGIGVAVMGAKALTRAEVEEALGRISERVFGKARAAVAAAGVECEEQVLEGKPSEEIVRHAVETECDLIVIGARGLSAVEKLLIGSVSSQVLHYAPCAVTLVR